MRNWLICCCSLALVGPATATEYENLCHDQKVWEAIDGLLAKVPNDPLVIRTYALRRGLCRLIDENKISLEQGAELFELEKRRTLMERAQEHTPRPTGQPAEAFEPRA